MQNIYLKIPGGIYLLKINNRDTKTKCGTCSKLAIKAPERRLCQSLFFNKETSDKLYYKKDSSTGVVLVSLLLTRGGTHFLYVRDVM